jgi:hypothetical protein
VRRSNYLPHSAAFIIFLLALCPYCASLLPFLESAFLSAAAMGKRGSSAAGAAAVTTKKAKTKTADADAPAVVGAIAGFERPSTYLSVMVVAEALLVDY